MKEQILEKELMAKSPSMRKSTDFKEWFLSRCEQFNKVDLKESMAIALENNAKLKQCYHNCWHATIATDLKYYEGFVWSKDLPIAIEHSFLVKDGVVIDPTLILPVRKNEFGKGTPPINRKVGERIGDEYIGVHIPTRTLNKFVFKKMITGKFLIDYYQLVGLK